MLPGSDAGAAEIGLRYPEARPSEAAPLRLPPCTRRSPMRVVSCVELGAPEKLVLEERPDLSPLPGLSLIHI